MCQSSNKQSPTKTSLDKRRLCVVTNQLADLRDRVANIVAERDVASPRAPRRRLHERDRHGVAAHDDRHTAIALVVAVDAGDIEPVGKARNDVIAGGVGTRLADVDRELKVGKRATALVVIEHKRML